MDDEREIAAFRNALATALERARRIPASTPGFSAAGGESARAVAVGILSAANELFTALDEETGE